MNLNNNQKTYSALECDDESKRNEANEENIESFSIFCKRCSKKNNGQNE